MDITDWDSAGINWEKPQPASLYNALESIRLALLERISVTGIDLENLPPVMKNICTKGIRLRSIYEVASEFHRNISTVIPYFVNHTDNSGNWNNQEEIPTWTEESILDAIGDSERVPVSRLGSSAEWVIQAYKILNMLKWYKDSGTITTDYTISERSNTDGASSSWNAAQFDATYGFTAWPWRYVGFPYQAFYAGWKGGIPTGYWKQAKRVRKRFGNETFKATFDIYLFLERFKYAYPSRGVNVFQPIGTMVHEDKWNLKESESSEENQFSTYCWNDDDLKADLLEPTMDIWCGTQVSEFISVTKFDGANGFKFLTQDE